MIIDSSAIVAILNAEDEAEAFSSAILACAQARMSAGNYLEASIVIDGNRDPVISARLDSVMAEFEIGIEPVTAEHAKLARQAYRDFGKGSGHPAKLNFGDCFAYALAMERGEPLLYKGDDFVHAGLARVVG
jgi:ribonuclease VapC